MMNFHKLDVSGAYLELSRALQGRCQERRKLGNNTWAERRDAETIVIRLHGTDILTFTLNSVKANAGAWFTVTTKARLNQYLPGGLGIGQVKGVWYWHLYNGETSRYIAEFTNGDTIQNKKLHAQGWLPLGKAPAA